MRSVLRPAALLTAAMLATPACAENADRRLLTLDDYGAEKSLGMPMYSPDGSVLVYRFEEQLYIAGDKIGESTQLTSIEGGTWGAEWSADGESIYFLADRGEGTQLHRFALETPQQIEQVTHYENGVASINLSPDESRTLIVVSDDQLGGVSAGSEPIVVTRRHFKRDAGHGYITDGSLRHLHVYDIESKSLKRLTSGNFNDASPSWSPDGSAVVFTSNRQAVPDTDYRSNLFVVNAEGDAAIVVRLTDDAATKSSPRFSPDGEQIAFLTAEDGVYAINRIALISAEGGETRALTPDFDRSVWSYQWSDDGEWIYFSYPNRGAMSLGRVNVESGHIESLITDDRQIGTYDVASSGAIAFTSSEAATGRNLFQRHNKRTTQLTDANRAFFDTVALGDKRKVTVPSSDGVMIDTFITTPPNYDPSKSYPAVLNIHGGPVDQFGWGYSFSSQYMASRGYVVIEPNPRGSAGRGQNFVRSIYRAWGLPDYDDVISAVDYAVSEGIADADKLAVTGYSYGGYMTNVVITETDRFKAAVSAAGHSLIEANVGHDMYSQWYFWELEEPWKHRDRYDVHSPYRRVEKVTTPTLFYGGRVDWNVPLLNAELMYQALQVKGVESQLVVYPGMHHGGWSADFEKDALSRTVDWFDRFTN